MAGGHTYADEGNDTAKVTLTHTPDHATSTVSGSVAVGEGDMLTGHVATIAAKLADAAPDGPVIVMIGYTLGQAQSQVSERPIAKPNLAS